MRTLLYIALAALIGLAAVPNAAAQPDDPHCFQDCDWLENLIKDTVGKFIDTPKSSTCDGYPAVIGKVLDECPHGPTL